MTISCILADRSLMKLTLVCDPDSGLGKFFRGCPNGRYSTEAKTGEERDQILQILEKIGAQDVRSEGLLPM